jgi:hypothetical protein
VVIHRQIFAKSAVYCGLSLSSLTPLQIKQQGLIPAAIMTNSHLMGEKWGAPRSKTDSDDAQATHLVGIHILAASS